MADDRKKVQISIDGDASGLNAILTEAANNVAKIKDAAANIKIGTSGDSPSQAAYGNTTSQANASKNKEYPSIPSMGERIRPDNAAHHLAAKAAGAAKVSEETPEIRGVSPQGRVARDTPMPYATLANTSAAASVNRPAIFPKLGGAAFAHPQGRNSSGAATPSDTVMAQNVDEGNTAGAIPADSGSVGRLLPAARRGRSFMKGRQQRAAPPVYSSPEMPRSTIVGGTGGIPPVPPPIDDFTPPFHDNIPPGMYGASSPYILNKDIGASSSRFARMDEDSLRKVLGAPPGPATIKKLTAGQAKVYVARHQAAGEFYNAQGVRAQSDAELGAARAKADASVQVAAHAVERVKAAAEGSLNNTKERGEQRRENIKADKEAKKEYQSVLTNESNSRADHDHKLKVDRSSKTHDNAVNRIQLEHELTEQRRLNRVNDYNERHAGDAPANRIIDGYRLLASGMQANYMPSSQDIEDINLGKEILNSTPMNQVDAVKRRNAITSLQRFEIMRARKIQEAKKGTTRQWIRSARYTVGAGVYAAYNAAGNAMGDITSNIATGAYDPMKTAGIYGGLTGGLAGGALGAAAGIAIASAMTPAAMMIGGDAGSAVGVVNSIADEAEAAADSVEVVGQTATAVVPGLEGEGPGSGAETATNKMVEGVKEAAAGGIKGSARTLIGEASNLPMITAMTAITGMGIGQEMGKTLAQYAMAPYMRKRSMQMMLAPLSNFVGSGRETESNPLTPSSLAGRVFGLMPAQFKAVFGMGQAGLNKASSDIIGEGLNTPLGAPQVTPADMLKMNHLQLDKYASASMGINTTQVNSLANAISMYGKTPLQQHSIAAGLYTGNDIISGPQAMETYTVLENAMITSGSTGIAVHSATTEPGAVSVSPSQEFGHLISQNHMNIGNMAEMGKSLTPSISKLMNALGKFIGASDKGRHVSSAHVDSAGISADSSEDQFFKDVTKYQSMFKNSKLGSGATGRAAIALARKLKSHHGVDAIMDTQSRIGILGILYAEEQREAQQHKFATSAHVAEQSGSYKVTAASMMVDLGLKYGQAAPGIAKELAPLVGNWYMNRNPTDALLNYGPQVYDFGADVHLFKDHLTAGQYKSYGAFKQANFSLATAQTNIRSRGHAELSAVQKEEKAIEGMPDGKSSLAYKQTHLAAMQARLSAQNETDIVDYQIPMAKLSGELQRSSLVPYAPSYVFGLTMQQINMNRQEVKALKAREATLKRHGELSEQTQLQFTQQIQGLYTQNAAGLAQLTSGMDNLIPGLMAGRPNFSGSIDSFQLASMRLNQGGVPTSDYGAANAKQLKMQMQFREAIGLGAANTPSSVPGLMNQAGAGLDTTNNLLGQIVSLLSKQQKSLQGARHSDIRNAFSGFMNDGLHTAGATPRH